MSIEDKNMRLSGALSSSGRKSYELLYEQTVQVNGREALYQIYKWRPGLEHDFITQGLFVRQSDTSVLQVRILSTEPHFKQNKQITHDILSSLR
jgi:hypothetical protein